MPALLECHSDTLCRRYTEDNDDDKATPAEGEDRVNFASKEAGAMIIATSKDMKGASNLLEDHQDKYALTPCGSKKWYLVIQLSEDVRLRLACPRPRPRCTCSRTD